MIKKSLFLLILILLITPHGTAGLTSLSQVFCLGKGIIDRDGDTFGDKVTLTIIIPDRPNAPELALAGDIAARVNLESLVVDFSLIKKESEAGSILSLENPILIGNNLEWLKKLEKQGKLSLPRLQSDQGLVSLLSYKNKPLVILTAGSKEALLKTGRSFFLRWPYLWEIWGREQGATYFSLEKDIAGFLEDQGVKPDQISIQAALYEFPSVKILPQTIKRLKFNSGDIQNLTVTISFSDEKQKEKAHQALEFLRLQQKRGLKTDILNYPGCARITFELFRAGKKSQVELQRLGFPKRILTPSYKPRLRARISGKNFDLLGIFSTQGFYSDSDNDRIPDTLNTVLIIPRDSSFLGVSPLASRLVLGTAGASFPVISLDEEVENPRSLVAPVLIGRANSLNQDLAKKGKLKIPDLEKGWGMAQVVPEAFNKSNALALAGADAAGIESLLSYLSQTFPFFEEYKQGAPRINDIPLDLEKFLKGETGSAEAFFQQKLIKTAEDLRGKELELLNIELFLPQENRKFEETVRELIEAILHPEKMEIKSIPLNEGKTVFQKEKEFTWEADEGLSIIQEYMDRIKGSPVPVRISLGVSESPEVRKDLKSRIESLLRESRIPEFEVKVLSAYKQGFFWIREEVIPSLRDKKARRLVIKFAEETDNLKIPKRFYSESFRWLQELYPVDEVISMETGIPLEKIEFELSKDNEPVYEVLAYDEKDEIVLRETFSPRIREASFLKVLPEWGKVKLTTGWLKIEQGSEALLDQPLMTDLERFWDYYQDEILTEVNSFVMKKTGNEPAFSKQPYFKKLQVEMWFSEPDYRLGTDEEIISSLEAMHDELYFDTLDFLRGITEVEIEEKEVPEDTSRYSAPGNILPLIHPSAEGGQGKVKIVFEDWQARAPQVSVKWKEKGKETYSKKISFPSLKANSLRVPMLIYNGQEQRVENLFVDIQFEKEAEYLILIDLLERYRELVAKGAVQPFEYPHLNEITLRIKFKDLEKEETLPVSPMTEESKGPQPDAAKKKTIVPTDKIISHQMCLDIVDRLSRFKPISSYIAGRSYENRQIPIIEMFSPLEKYTSLPRLITFKPTLYLSARQHANEVSSTNYVLKFAELVAKEESFQKYLEKMNIVIHPMENPDGTDLAFELQKLTPFHSLHAGRYSSLGMEIGYQVNVARPLLPEAKVRRYLYDRWLPDIYLNLHGYPSHEWVQQFSNYSPYLFRDYWIPRGWFAYYSHLTLPLYQRWKEAAEDLMKFITEEIQANERLSSSNRKFYDRYYRWASRWQPHLDYIELHDGVNIYARRRSSSESRLSPRRQVTFVEQTPELMDETAQGEWLSFLCEQGLTYLRAHTQYLAQVKFETIRLEEESQDRVHIRFIRSRPGKIEK